MATYSTAAADKLSPAAPARIVDVQIQGSESIITIDRGSDQGVARGWRGWLVRNDGKRVPEGEFAIVRVTKKTCIGKVRLGADAIAQGRYRVELDPP